MNVRYRLRVVGLVACASILPASGWTQLDPQEAWRVALEFERAALTAQGAAREALAATAYERFRPLLAWYGAEGTLEPWCVAVARMTRLAFLFDPDLGVDLHRMMLEESDCHPYRVDDRPLLETLAAALPDAPRAVAASHSERVTVRVSHGKMGIEITGASYLMLEPLSARERLTLAVRRVPLRNVDTAVELGGDLLRRAEIPFTVSASEEVIVFGAFGSQEDADWVASIVGQMRDGLVESYFAAAEESPVVLFVNLSYDGEAAGAALSEAVHFHPRSELEGYFEPLDQTIVLRKNILFEDGIYLGTAQHELVHALVSRALPGAPGWLDEGLAALYEETAGDTPLDNYRYFYVDAAIERGVLPSVGALLDATPDRFPAEYGRLVDAMARYLALYLFERPYGRSNALARVVRDLTAAPTDSSPAVEAARLVLITTGFDDAAELDTDFRAWIRAREPSHAYERFSALRDPIEDYVGALGPIR